MYYRIKNIDNTDSIVSQRCVFTQKILFKHHLMRYHFWFTHRYRCTETYRVSYLIFRLKCFEICIRTITDIPS